MKRLRCVFFLLPALLVPAFVPRSALALPPGAPPATTVLRRAVAQRWIAKAPLDAQVIPLPMPDQEAHGVRCFTVRYTSHQAQGAPVRIFGFYAYPARAPRPLPALLFVHGGGGYATLGRVTEAAARGFAAFSIDLPGKGTRREKFSRSTGPDMTVPQIFRVRPRASDSYLFHAVLAEMRAITFLCSRPEVDPRRIGLVGASWGGATGLLTTSLDRRVACLVDLFGAGYLREGSCWQRYFRQLRPADLDVWDENYDASRFVAGIHVPVFAITGTNDGCYWLPEFLRTMRAIHPAPRLLCLPNLNHRIDARAREAFYAWLGAQLQRAPDASGPASLSVQSALHAFPVRVRTRRPAQQVTISYASFDKDTLAHQTWTTVVCAPHGQDWLASVPHASVLTYLFATIRFAGGQARSTSVHTAARCRIGTGPATLDIPFMCPNLARAAGCFERQVRLGRRQETDPDFWDPLLLAPAPQAAQPVRLAHRPISRFPLVALVSSLLLCLGLVIGTGCRLWRRRARSEALEAC